MNDHGSEHDAIYAEIERLDSVDDNQRRRLELLEQQDVPRLERRIAALEAMAHGDHRDYAHVFHDHLNEYASADHAHDPHSHGEFGLFAAIDHTHAATPPVEPVPPELITKPIPADGRIKESGIYSGTFTNENIGAWSYAIMVQAPDVTILDSVITSTGFGIGQWGSRLKVLNTRFETNNSAVAMWNQMDDLLMDGCEVVMRGKNAFFLAQDKDGDNLTSKLLRDITIQNSTFENIAGGHEGIYVNNAENVKILSNIFKRGLNQWFTSFPDCLNVEVRDNSFDLTSPETWAAVELPRTFGAKVFDNDVFGDGRLFYVNSGSTGIEHGNNTLRDGAVLGNP